MDVLLDDRCVYVYWKQNKWYYKIAQYRVMKWGQNSL